MGGTFSPLDDQLPNCYLSDITKKSYKQRSHFRKMLTLLLARALGPMSMWFFILSQQKST
jgi:hypothetical protein